MNVLVTDSSNITFVGLEKNIGKVLSADFFFKEKDKVENDFNYKQLIPYVVLYHENSNSVSYYLREGGAESRLENKISIGYGGHIEEVDKDFYEDNLDALLNCAKREIIEEAPNIYQYIDSIKILGAINYDELPVDKVHLGVLFLCYVNEKIEGKNLQWIRLDEAESIKQYFESWSILALEETKKECSLELRDRNTNLIRFFDDKYGFVQLIDFMGKDEDIAIAAKTSYGKSYVTKNDAKRLINYLMKHMHTTPFEMCEMKFRIRIPMDAWRQMIRHRTASVNERSTRYTEALTRFYSRQKWNVQSSINKQGSGEFLDSETNYDLFEREKKLHQILMNEYKYRLSKGVAKEQARKDLPLSTYTEAIWKIDLHNLFHFLQLRMDYHAQYEIRQYANLISKFVKACYPIAYSAFEEHRLNARKFSKNEFELIKKYLNIEELLKEAQQIMNKREFQEFIQMFK